LGSNEEQCNKALDGFNKSIAIFSFLASIALICLAIGICSVSRISRLVPKLKANHCSITVHCLFLLSNVVFYIFSSLITYVSGSVGMPEIILSSIGLLGHNIFMLYMIFKFGRQSLFVIRYTPNRRKINVVATKTKRVIFERNLTNAEISRD